MTARDNGADIDVRFAGLQQRVTGIETAVQGVAQQVTALATTLNDRSRTPWGVLFAGASVMVTIIVVVGGLAYAPLRETLAETKTDLRAVSNNSLSVASFVDFKNTYENNRIVNRTDSEAKMAALSASIQRDITRIEETLKNQVPRDEHERVWANYEQRDADLQRQLDELKAQAASTYGVRDVILDYRERLDRLERTRSGVGTPPG